jgi:hypothetical protein
MRGQDTRSDADILAVLDRRAAGESCTAIAARSGVSRSAILGLVYRVNLDADRAESAPPPVGQTRPVKPENCDGGMPARWWVAGLRKQTEIENRFRRQGMRK